MADFLSLARAAFRLRHLSRNLLWLWLWLSRRSRGRVTLRSFLL
jgi:hypothetical protein